MKNMGKESSVEFDEGLWTLVVGKLWWLHLRGGIPHWEKLNVVALKKNKVKALGNTQ